MAERFDKFVHELREAIRRDAEGVG